MTDSEKRDNKPKVLGLKGGTNTVRQSFSHGRSKSVVVETRKKKLLISKKGPVVEETDKNVVAKIENDENEEILRRKKAIEASKAEEKKLQEKNRQSESSQEKVSKPEVETKKEVVANKTDTKKINTEWQLLAEEGSAMAQYKLASMYEQGEGLLKDFVYAHMWANLSATNGYAEAKDLRDALEKKMTASQMEKAQDLARECMKNKFKGC